MSICKCGARLQNLNTETGRAFICTGCGRYGDAAPVVVLPEETEGEKAARIETARQWARDKVAEWEKKHGTAYKERFQI